SYLRSARKAFDAMGHYRAEAEYEIGFRQQPVRSDARAVGGVAEVAQVRLVQPPVLMQREAAIVLAQLLPQLALRHRAVSAGRGKQGDLLVADAGCAQLLQHVGHDARD